MTQGVMSSGRADPAIPYATPSARPSAPVLAGAAILLGGLGLIVLGGCFLIGAMIANLGAAENAAQSGAPGSSGLTAGLIVLLGVLYVAAFGCFAGAASLLFMGTRALLRVFSA